MAAPPGGALVHSSSGSGAGSGRLGGIEQRLGGIEQRLGGIEQRLDGLSLLACSSAASEGYCRTKPPQPVGAEAGRAAGEMIEAALALSFGEGTVGAGAAGRAATSPVGAPRLHSRSEQLALPARVATAPRQDTPREGGGEAAAPARPASPRTMEVAMAFGGGAQMAGL